MSLINKNQILRVAFVVMCAKSMYDDYEIRRIQEENDYLRRNNILIPVTSGSSLDAATALGLKGKMDVAMTYVAHAMADRVVRGTADVCREEADSGDSGGTCWLAREYVRRNPAPDQRPQFTPDLPKGIPPNKDNKLNL